MNSASLPSNSKEARYAAVLEIRSNNSKDTGPKWAARTFRLIGQTFEFYDGDRLKGTINTAGCKTKVLTSDECDGKEYPFIIETERKDIIYLNATSSEIREKCIIVLNYSSKSAIWAMPEEGQNGKKRDIKKEEQKLKSYQQDVSHLEEELNALRIKNEREAKEKNEKILATKHAQLLQAQKENMYHARRQFASIILQSVWRGAIARRRARKIKASKITFYPEYCAVKIQTRFRMIKARKIMLALKRERMKERQQKALAKMEQTKRKNSLLLTARYAIDLEMQSSGRNKAWVMHNCVLIGQTFEFFQGEKLKGKIALSGSTVSKVPPEQVSGKPYGILIDTGKDKIYFNAQDSASHKLVSELLASASKTTNWKVTTTPNESLRSRKKKILSEDRKMKLAKASLSIVEGEDIEELRRKRDEDRVRRKLLREEKARLKALEIQNQIKASLSSVIDHSPSEMDPEEVGDDDDEEADDGIIDDEASDDEEGIAESLAVADEFATPVIGSKPVNTQSTQSENRSQFDAMEASIDLDDIDVHTPNHILSTPISTPIKPQQMMMLGSGNDLAATMIQKHVRKYLAFLRVATLLHGYPQMALITIHQIRGSCKDTATGAISSFVEPSAWVSGITSPSPFGFRRKDVKLLEQHQALNNNSSTGGLSNFITTSLYKSPPLYNANEEKEVALITSEKGIAFVTLTLSEKDEFQGQAFVPIAKHFRLFRSTYIPETEVSLDNYLLPIQDPSEEHKIVVKRAWKGFIRISSTIPDRTYSMCGWMYKLSESMLSKSWKKRWFVLINGTIQYYNSQYGLDKPKNIIICAEVKSIKMSSIKGRKAIIIAFQNESINNFWTVSFDDENTPDHCQFMASLWLRKLALNCPNAINTTYQPVQLAPKGIKSSSTVDASPKNANNRSSNQINGSVDPEHPGTTSSPSSTSSSNLKPKVPLSKRMSLFK